MPRPLFGSARSGFRWVIARFRRLLRRWCAALPLSLVGVRVTRLAPRRPRCSLSVKALEGRLPPSSLLNPLLGGTTLAVGREDRAGTTLTAGGNAGGDGKSVPAPARPKDDRLSLPETHREDGSPTSKSLQRSYSTAPAENFLGQTRCGMEIPGRSACAFQKRGVPDPVRRGANDTPLYQATRTSHPTRKVPCFGNVPRRGFSRTSSPGPTVAAHEPLHAAGSR
jgi:hypothetical protein